MYKKQELLSLGTVVLLKEGLQKLLIVGRGAMYIESETKEDVVSDYMAVLYPTGKLNAGENELAEEVSRSWNKNITSKKTGNVTTSWSKYVKECLEVQTRILLRRPTGKLKTSKYE